MKHFSSIFLLMTVVSITSNFAQNPGYTPLRHQGNLPAEVHTPVVDVYDSLINQMRKGSNGEELYLKKKFYLNTIFSISSMMRSGMVLYNEEYNEYLERIADALLGNGELRQKVHFYLLRSPVLNAFASGDGNIFISLGLIASLDTEAELAFVMAHEIGHVAKEHGLDFYLESSKIDKKKASNNSILKKASFGSSLFVKNLYSQTLELEADSWGADLFLKSDYNIEAINSVLEKLRYAYLPFGTERFEPYFLEDINYEIADWLIIDSVKSISGAPGKLKYAMAIKSTHPSVGVRKDSLVSKIEMGRGSLDFRLSEATFKSLKSQSQNEMAAYYLDNQLYQDAIYASWQILKNDPENYYHQKVIAHALTQLTKFRNNQSESVYAETADYMGYEGEQQRLYYLLGNMNSAELTVMTSLYNFRLLQKHPDDVVIRRLCIETLRDIRNIHFTKPDVFLKDSTISSDSLQTIARKVYRKFEPEPGKNKFANKKTYQTVYVPDKDKKHLLYAYNSYWSDSLFNSLWHEAYLDNYHWNNIANYTKSNAKKIIKNGVKLDIDKVVVVDPSYQRYDLRKGGSVKFIEAEKGEIQYLDVLKENADLFNIQIEFLDPLLMAQGDAEQLNDLNNLNQWLTNQISLGDVDLPSFNQDEVNQIVDKYGTPYFLWTGILSVRTKPTLMDIIYYTGLGVLYPPILIGAILELTVPQYEFLFVAVLYDVQNMEVEKISSVWSKQNDSRSTLNPYVYDMFYQISQAEN